MALWCHRIIPAGSDLIVVKLDGYRGWAKWSAQVSNGMAH